MGKQAKLKAMRKIAKQLPVVNVKGIERTVKTGAELIAAGMTTFGTNVPIDSKLNYRQIKSVPVPVNHKRQMKQLYNKHGYNGVKSYLTNVKTLMQEVLQKESAEDEKAIVDQTQQLENADPS